MRLETGGFYVSRDGRRWCCFRFDEKAPVHAQARCVRVSDDRIEYFFADGRYDQAGTREHTLIAEWP